MIGIDERQVSCPCTLSSTPGWSPTGVTENQLERLADEAKMYKELMHSDTAECVCLLGEMRADYRLKVAPIIPTAEMGSA